MSEEFVNINIGKVVEYVKRYRWLQVFLSVFFILSLLESHIGSSGPDGLAYTIQYELIMHHTFAFGSKSIMKPTTDQIFLISPKSISWYSSSMPSFALLFLPFVYIPMVIHPATINLSTAGYFDRLGVSMFSAILVAEMYRWSKKMGRGEYESLLIALLFFSTTMFPFSVIFYYHNVTALAILESVMYTYFILTERENNYMKLVAWLIFAGFISSSDNIAVLPLLMLPIAVLVVYLASNVRKKTTYRRGLTLFFISSIGVTSSVLFYLLSSYMMYGNIILVPYVMTDSHAFVGAVPIIAHFFEYMFSPYRGILIYDPIVMLSLSFIFYKIGKERKMSIYDFIAVVLFLSNAVFASSWKYWDGGLSNGPRFLIPTMPLLLLAIDMKRLKRIVHPLFLFGLIINAIATFGFPLAPVSPSNYEGFGGWNDAYTIYYSLSKILSHGSFTWFLMKSGAVAGYTALVFFIIAVFSIFTYIYSRYENASTTFKPLQTNIVIGDTGVKDS